MRAIARAEAVRYLDTHYSIFMITFANLYLDLLNTIQLLYAQITNSIQCFSVLLFVGY